MTDFLPDSPPDAMTVSEAFAAIPLAAVCCDQTFGKDEARVIREQLLSRSLFQQMEPYAFGLLISRLLKRYREESWQGLIAAAAPALNRHQQETAFALACQLIHCDRKVSAAEREFLEALAAQLSLAQERASQIAEVCEILHRDDLFAVQS
jgi:hypothetical protein